MRSSICVSSLQASAPRALPYGYGRLPSFRYEVCEPRRRGEMWNPASCRRRSCSSVNPASRAASDPVRRRAGGEPHAASAEGRGPALLCRSGDEGLANVGRELSPAPLDLDRRREGARSGASSVPGCVVLLFRLDDRRRRRRRGSSSDSSGFAEWHRDGRRRRPSSSFTTGESEPLESLRSRRIWPGRT
jgi:hypothetical protein